MRPRLKGVVWQRVGEEVRLVYDRRDHFVLTDPDGVVEKLLDLLRDGGRTTGELSSALLADGVDVPVDDVDDALAVFDEHGLLEDGDRLGTFEAAVSERYFSNFAFFESFASLRRSHEDLQHVLRNSHVLVLGTGGLNSNTIPHLCGMGVGRLTLVDRDMVEPRNFARQYLYRWSDIGAKKVHRAARWVEEFDPDVKVEAIERSITGPAVIDELISETQPDLVLAGVDSPIEIDDWMNRVCVSRRTPYIRGGMYVTQGLVFSVDPGRSPCKDCLEVTWRNHGLADDADVATDAALELFRNKPRTNRGIGPVAGLLGSLVSFEALRYLTRYEEPAYSGAPIYIDFASGCTTERFAWQREPDCPTCSGI